MVVGVSQRSDDLSGRTERIAIFLPRRAPKLKYIAATLGPTRQQQLGMILMWADTPKPKLLPLDALN